VPLKAPSAEAVKVIPKVHEVLGASNAPEQVSDTIPKFVVAETVPMVIVTAD
jgi:hypothetical protein